MVVPDVGVGSLFAPAIAPYVRTLVDDGRVGVCGGGLRVQDVNTGSGEVIFNCQYPEEPPDFIFGEMDQDFLPDMDKVQSLSSWRPDCPESLLNVIVELLREYSAYQKELVAKNSRLQFEFTYLTGEEYRPDDVEVHVTRKHANRMGPVNFLIKLPIDFSRIPPYLTKDNPGEDLAVLQITFESPDSGKVHPQLYLSPRIENVFGDATSLHIPPFPSGACFMDYIPGVCELINGKLEQVCYSYEKRKECISAFLSLFERSVVEFDAEAFTCATFLLEWHNFFFGFSIELPEKFPRDYPVYQFQSMYHEGEDGQPFCQAYSEPPFSPRWSASEVAERARTFIFEKIVAFQRGSVAETTLRK